jgi:hypothetical protein
LSRHRLDHQFPVGGRMLDLACANLNAVTITFASSMPEGSQECRHTVFIYGSIAESVGKTEKEINGLGPQSGASLGSKAAALLVLSRLR